MTSISPDHRAGPVYLELQPEPENVDSGHEILDYVLLALDEHPQRLDLWAMRFEIVRSLGLKDSFATAMLTAQADTKVRAGLDWHAVRRMWDELAPAEPPPAGVKLPPSAPPEGPRKMQQRRFADLALERAGTPLQALAAEYQALRARPGFFKDLARATREHLKRPTRLSRATRLERSLDFAGGIYLKREDGLRNSPEREYAIAQSFIASALGRQRLICANDVDGFAFELARAARHFALELTVVLGPGDLRNTALVDELRHRGASIVSTGELDLEDADAREVALHLWTEHTDTAHLALGFGSGPNPYPRMVQDFQMLLGQETGLQLRAEPGHAKRHIVIAAVQSEADSIGFMLPFLRNPDVELIMAEAGPATGRESQDSVRWANYHGARREQNWLRATGALTYIPIHDRQAAEARQQLAEIEGAHISLEDGRAVALACGLVEGGVAERDLVVLIA